MPDRQIQVYVVDDEPSICTAYARLLRSAGMLARTFASVEEFMRSDFADENACVVADIKLPGKSGLELPVLLGRAGHLLPVIFVTGSDTPATRDLALRFGAAAYFRKPVPDHELLDAIRWAIIGQRPA
jgi:FixJ family two-component response regulator